MIWGLKKPLTNGESFEWGLELRCLPHIFFLGWESALRHLAGGAASNSRLVLRFHDNHVMIKCFQLHFVWTGIQDLVARLGWWHKNCRNRKKHCQVHQLSEGEIATVVEQAGHLAGRLGVWQNRGDFIRKKGEIQKNHGRSQTPLDSLGPVDFDVTWTSQHGNLQEVKTSIPT